MMKIGNTEVYGIIYKITNKVNGKVYIGQTVRSFKERYGFSGIGVERVYKYNNYNKSIGEKYNKHLLSSIEKYGFDSFEVDENFDKAYSKEELNDKEMYWIKYYDSTNPSYGYNNQEGGSNGRRSRASILRTSISNNYIVCCKNDKKVFLNLTEAGEYYQLSPSTIGECIREKRKTQDGLVFIRPNIKESTIIVDLDTLDLYYNATELGKIYNKSPETLRKNCLNEHCKTYINGEKRHFLYLRIYREKLLDKEEYIGIREEKVVDLDTFEIYDSCKQASQVFNVNESKIKRNCEGVSKRTRINNEWKKFMYLKDYEREIK